ncbi:2-phospho-L-lactate guanylyltransferase [Halorubrum gandharaense]
MDVLVPFSADRPKSRLSDVLDRRERAAFARVLLTDVLDAASTAAGATDGEVRVLVTDEIEVEHPVIVDERGLSTAVNDALEEAPRPVAVVMADLALATSRTLTRLFTADGEVVVAPGRGGGTNALVVRHPEFRVDYHGASFLDHLRNAGAVGASVREFDSHRLATDIDEPADLADLLVHGDGAAADWLHDAGFELDTSDGRVAAVRSE